MMDEVFAAQPSLRALFAASPVARGQPAESLIEHVPDRPGHDRRYAINYAKARGDLGYSPNLDLHAGLRETVQWYVSNRSWWQPLLGRH